ncbi:PhzF family phenazine biosynthesis protein [Phyllobacterium sp. 21LDTY02-6]|uniref:PhzF family phenazine biosynthesis protein n=1 Tax=Phyllobacterium sp. 21LDTY02-6 TaxID=2944903 RepID=UPI002021A1C1|nr:PhzF family phenazine biosynthesis protein [Phyllobacterium sp. 21LDTY02-6]MCO4319788.1 PhzF family phenazine biosynthesis protein [Phyllobacterium sp. 21LDTY02-6]
MTRLDMYQVDAFTTELFSGNPAAVLVLDDWLGEATMQSIAAENNLAETAFVRRGRDGWDLRWFTPVHEVDFCGHATLASAHVLARELGIKGPYSFETRVGTLRVSEGDGAYQLDFPSFPPEPLGDVELPEGLSATPIVAAFRNFENVFIEIESEAALAEFVPDHQKILRLQPLSLVVTARGDEHDFVSRYFAPHAGIPEDPVTGSIHATLTPYWAGKLGKNRLSAFQRSRRGGRLGCELAGDRVLITGAAITFMKAEIYLP